MLIGELDQFVQSRTDESLGDAPLHPGPEKLGGTGAVAICLVRAGDLAFGVGVEALHRCDRTLERLHDLEHLDLAGGAAEAVAAVRSALALDQPGLPQLRDQ